MVVGETHHFRKHPYGDFFIFSLTSGPQERDAALRSELQAINDKFLGKRKKVRFFWDEAEKGGRLISVRKV